MKVKVIDDNEGLASRRIRAIKRLKVFTEEPQWVWERCIDRLSKAIEPDDIVVLDVNLGPLGEEAGFDVFLKLLEKYGANAEQLSISIVFASVEPCRKRLENRLDESLKQRLSSLHDIGQVAFVQDDFSGNLSDAMRQILGFSIKQATEILFNPFQALHADIQFIKANPEATATDFDWDYYAQLPDRLKSAEKYLAVRLSRYAQLFGCTDRLTPIRQYLNGALARLCQTFESEIASEEPSERLVQLVSNSSAGANFLEEFQAVVDAIKAIDAHKL